MALMAPVAWLALGMTVPLSGKVEDAAGRPVAGATVWLGDTIATRQGPEVLATTQTDDRGRFRLERADDLVGRGVMWSPTLWAYRPGFHVAFIEFKGNLPKAGEPVRLVLGPPASTSLRVLQPNGQPTQRARIRLVQVNLKAPRPPDGMLDHLAATTDTDGRCTLDGFTPADILALDVTAEGQLVQCLPIDPDTGTVTLRPLGWLKARIVADDPKALRGWTITAWSRPTEPGYRGPYRTHRARETTGDDGRVAFPPLAEGQVDWAFKAPEGSNYLAAKAPRAAIRAGETEAVEIKVVRAVRVEGTVVEEPGGAPIPGVTIDLDSLTHSRRRVNWIVTDAQGRFSTLVLPGQARFSFWLHGIPKTHFLPPHTPHWADLQVQEGADRQTFAPPRLRRAVQVRGRVVDEAGKPAAGVNVAGSWTSAEHGNNPNSIPVKTDARGEFVLGNIAPKSEVKLSASSGSVAESESVTVPTAGEGGPITLLLKKRPTLALAGRVLGPDGRPLADATVRVKIRPTDQAASSGGDFAFEGSKEIRTGRDGRYKTPAQLPIGYEYRVAAQAPGYEPGKSGWVVAPAVDVADLRLRRSIGTRAVAGRVVDSAGKSVAGAEVYQSGDGPKKTRGTTDNDGRFRVPGVPNAPAFLFVSKESYHFLGRRVDPSDRSLEFTLRRLDEPPATPLRPAAAPVSRDEERAIARALIAEAQKSPGGVRQVTMTERMQIPTALVDPNRVVEMIENQVLTAGPGLLTALAIARFEDDPRKALEIMGAIDQPDTASFAALGLFDRLGATASPEFRRELLARAARQAREIKDPGQAASLLARVADRRLDLGDADRGSGLVREAQVLAEKSRQQPFPDPSDDLAPVLARIDLPAALKLLESRAGQPYQLEMIRTGIANRIAAADPAAARRILGMIEEYRQPAARRVACLRMAAKDLPAARGLAAEDRDPMVEALLPAMAARDRAGSDPDGARALLREAVERLGKLGDSQAVRPSPAVALARLLPLAVRIDPDRAPDDLWLALSRRPPLPALPESIFMTDQVRQRYLDLAELAVLVARYDRAAAEAVFAPVADRLVGLEDENRGLGNEGPAIFRAAGAFDARVAKAMLDGLPEDPTPPADQTIGRPNFRHQSKAKARIALAEILGLPPGLRLREPFLPRDAGWLGDFED
jgi:hypothetical protein